MTMVEAVRRHALARPDRTACVFLADGETETARLSFAQVDLRARAVAAHLQDLGAAGERVVIAYPTSLEYVVAFLGCLYAGAVAVPCDAPERRSSLERLQRIVADARPGVMLAPPGDDRTMPAAGGSEAVPLFDVAEFPDASAEGWREPPADPEALALLQYTSGSTRTPRGVMVSHGNVIANERSIAETCHHDTDSAFVGWLPIFHDMGLIANLLQPLYLGSFSVLMPPTAFVANPVRWLRAIGRYGANTSGGPNFGYDLCALRASADDCADLDLSCWRVAFNGAEVVRPATMQRFAKAFAPVGFRPETFFPCYGLAEATLIVTGAPRGRPPIMVPADPVALRNGRLVEAAPGSPHKSMAACGPAAYSSTVMIVDPETRAECPPGRLGEVWVSGPSVARGYWERPEDTAATFQARVAETDGGPFLRTGDLGAFANGELVLVGRIKDMIVIRGQNYYPHDLEWTAEASHPGLRPSCGAAFAIDLHDEERLVIVYEAARGDIDVEEVAEAIRQAVLERHGIDVHAVAVVRRGGVPKTTSGKIRRGACRETFAAGRLPLLGVSWHRPSRLSDGQAFAGLPSPDELAALEPADRTAAVAAGILRTAAVRAGTPARDVRVTDPVSALGLDSLVATELQHALRDRYGVTLPPLTLLGDASFREVAAQVCALSPAPADLPANGMPAVDIDPADPREGPLSQIQRALWFEHESAPPDHAAYVLSRALRLRGPLDRDAFRRAFARLDARHPALRTRFAERDGEPIQLVRAAAGATSLAEEDASALKPEQLTARVDAVATRPFILLGADLFRATLLRRSADEHVLVLSAHHAVMDFWSFCVVLRDLLALYAEETDDPAPALPRLRTNPIEFAQAEPGTFDADRDDRMLAYWSKRLAAVPASLALPLDRPRPLERGFRGRIWRFRIDASRTERLREFSRERRCTLFTTLLTAYQVLLWRYSGQRDFTVGTLTNGRDSTDLTDVVGCFINPVPVRTTIDSPNERFDALLERTRHHLLQDLAHSDYPFGRLMGRLRPEREPGTPVLIQTMLILQKEFGAENEGMRAVALGAEGVLRAPGLTAESLPVPQPWSHVDLTVNLAEIDGGLTGVVEYDPDLFDEMTIAELTDRFGCVLDEVAAGPPGSSIGSLSLLRAADRDRAVSCAAGAVRPRRAEVGLPGLVAECARTVPDRIAVAAPGGAGQLTYRGLVRVASGLAARLRRLDIGPERPVGVLMERSVILPAVALAVWEMRAALVPLDPEDPPARLAWLAADAGVEVVVASSALADRVPAGVTRLVVDPAEPCADADARRTRFGQGEIAGDAAAYVLYTSGSTGRPKGVVVPHRGIVNRLAWMQEEFGLAAGERVLHKTPVTFDVSLWELLWPLLNGGCVVVARPGGHRDSSYLADVIAAEQIGVVHFVPSMLSAFADELATRAAGIARLPLLRAVVCSGEALPARLAERFERVLPAAGLWNLYGPTEASVDVTSWRWDGGPTVVIGRPIANVAVHVLDKDLEPLPAGVAGEIYLGGVGLARGYVNRPGLTAQLFVPDPYGPRGGRLYRTGDRARRRADDNVAYLGRADSQLKLAGNRIEPAEIEEALRGMPDIRDAAVVVHDADEGAVLAAHVVPNVDSRPPDETAIRRELRRRLPAALVPSSIVSHAAFPLTTSGKVNRKALPAPLPRRRTEPPSSAPATSLERRLANLWARVLSVTEVGIDDDFFALGGDSILAIRLVARARADGIQVTVSDLLRHGTVRALAAALADGTADGTADGSGDGPTVTSMSPFQLCAPATRADFSADVTDAYPISMAQQALLFQRMHNPGYEVYVTSLHLRGPFAAEPLREALALLIDRHPYLRSSFDLAEHHIPLQLVHRHAEPPLTVIDLRDMPARRTEEELRGWLRAERTRQFDIAEGSLVRVCVHLRDENEFQLTLSSFALDGWCSATVLTELLRDYGAMRHGEPAPTTPPRGGYADFVVLERHALGSARHRSFWAAELAGLRASRLPRRAARAQSPGQLQERHTVAIPPEVAAGLRNLAEDMSVPLKSVLLAAHLRVVRHLTARPSVVTGLEVNGRPEQLDGDRIVGVFNNIVPIRADISGSWADLVRIAFAVEARILPYRRYPLTQLERDHKLRRLFDTLFVYTHFHVYEHMADLDGLELLGGDAPDQTYFPLTAHFNVDARTGDLRLLLDYDPREVPADLVASAGHSYERALQLIAADPQRSCTADSLLAPAERRRYRTGGDPAPRRGGDTVHDIILAQAARTPDAVAIADADQQLSYAALAARSGRLATAVRAAGARPETVVGLHGPRGVDLVVALLAILRAGAAYLPMDPALPAERAVRMLDLAGASLLLAPADTPLRPPCRVLSWHSDAPRSAPPPAVHPANLAYVIFTSGSTGDPKAVGIPHQAVANYLAWCAEAYSIGPGCQAPVHSSIGFDLTVTSLLAPLAAGATVQLIADDNGLEAVGEALIRLPDTLLKITPGHFAAVGKQLALTNATPGLRSVIVGGEQLRRAHLEPWRPLLPDAVVMNEYGPSEATVGCCTYRVRSGDASDPIPIGRPIHGARAYPLDDHCLPVPAGAVAELHLGGIGLARGYLGRPGLTARQFVPDAVGPEAGARLYRSGDLAYYDIDGLLHFVGRRDRQLKIRGHRIEPAEIETELQRHPGVGEAAVLSRTDAHGRTRLVGFYVSASTGSAVRGLADWLAERLPAPMVPAELIPVAAFPRTPNGKIDYAALADVADSRRTALVEAVAGLSDDAVRALLDRARANNPGRH